MSVRGGNYKAKQRVARRFSIDSGFSSGMSFTNGVVEDGYMKTLVNYDIKNNGEALIPRSGLRTSELLLPNIVSENDPTYKEYHSEDSINIVAAKECVETDGTTYRQFILGRTETTDSPAKLWIATCPVSNTILSSNDYNPDNYSGDDYSFLVALVNADISGENCTYFTAPLTKIHGMTMAAESQVATVVGTFFGNSFYFIDPVEDVLKRTKLDAGTTKYLAEQVIPKTIDPSEATNIGYNMLLGSGAYSFVNRISAGIIQLTGILPYSVANPEELLMTPRKNEEIYLRCYFRGELGKKYKFVWNWRTSEDSEYTPIQTQKQSPEYEFVQGTPGTDEVWLKNGTTEEVTPYLQVLFKAPIDNIMVRVEAYLSTELEDVEQAMTMGFDFSTSMYGTATNVKMETYNLFDATGMTVWKQRLVLWGVPDDPTILFISDTNEPAYFPYPNNISIYEEPIVSVKPFLDSLLVFTTTQVHQVTLNEDGLSWTSVVIQSNLKIEAWDRHLIQVVKNMFFFKSGNYYFMVVPKAQSVTGELTLAPISNEVKEFFNNFEHNVTEILHDTFNFEGQFELINYYNFLDYEDVHNVYVMKFLDDTDPDDVKEGYIHIDLLYNTVNRSWRLHTFEAPHFLYPYQHDATQQGTLASTSLLDMELSEGSVGSEVAVRPASSRIVSLDELVLSEEGYDFMGAYNVRVRCIGPDNIVYFEKDFVDSLREAAHDYDGLGDIWYHEYISFVDDGMSVYIDYTLSSELARAGDRTDISRGFLLEGSSGDIKFKPGTTVEIYNLNNLDVPIWGPNLVKPDVDTMYIYDFVNDFIKVGSIIEFAGKKFVIDTMFEDNLGKVTFQDSSNLSGLRITRLDEGGYLFTFSEVYVQQGPTVTVKNLVSNPGGERMLGRCIQLYEFDNLRLKDLYFPDRMKVIYTPDYDNDYWGYDPVSISESVREVMMNIDDLFLFKNWQFLDSGYRRDDLFRNKRFRELQLMLNNIDGNNLAYGMEFVLDGQSRLGYMMYQVEHTIDVNDPNYGLIYVQGTPYTNLPLEYVGTPNETYLGPGTSEWILNQSLFPELSLWRVRAPISGKGLAPRLRLLSKNTHRFELMAIAWICRDMFGR